MKSKMLLSRDKIVKIAEAMSKYEPGLKVWIHFPITEDLIQCDIDEATRDKVLLSIPEDSDLFGAPKFWFKKANIVGTVSEAKTVEDLHELSELFLHQLISDYKTKYPKALAEDIGNVLNKYNITLTDNTVLGVSKEKMKELRQKIEELIRKQGLSPDAYEKKII